MADTRRGAIVLKRHRCSSQGATPRKTPVAIMAPLSVRPSHDDEDESEQDDSQHGDADVGPALKKIMPNPVTDSPEMTRSTTVKRVRTTKTSKSQSKRNSSKEQESHLASSPEPMAGAGGQVFNFPTLQQSGTPIILTATRMAPVPGLGCLFQDDYGIQMLVPYSMLPIQPRQQSFWPANYGAFASQPMPSSGLSLQSYGMPGGIGVGNFQYLNSGLGQYAQFQAQPPLRSTRPQPQAQPSDQGSSFDESFTTSSFESRGMTPSSQNQN